MGFSKNARRAAQRLTAAQREQVERTRRGLCSRCARPLHEHSGRPLMLCPDGSGRDFGFAFDRASRKEAIARLEHLRRMMDEGEKQRAALSEDARALLDKLAGDFDRDELDELALAAMAASSRSETDPIADCRTTASRVAAELGWSVQRVQLASLELEEQGLIQTKRGGQAN